MSSVIDRAQAILEPYVQGREFGDDVVAINARDLMTLVSVAMGATTEHIPSPNLPADMVRMNAVCLYAAIVQANRDGGP